MPVNKCKNCGQPLVRERTYCMNEKRGCVEKERELQEQKKKA